MENEISESAKAIQEVAKTARVGIEATEKLGGLVAKIINEPLKNVVGILTDKLQFMRFERQIHLHDRLNEILDERKITGHLKVVPPKLALPIIENALLEEDDELQDLWANLLASAVDPNFGGVIRSAFIDIIKQLEVVDVHVLKVIYDEFKTYENSYKDQGGRGVAPNSYSVTRWCINERVPHLTLRSYQNAVDNLIRVRCIDSYLEKRTITTRGEDPNMLNPARHEEVTMDHQYEQLCMTSLGVDFVEACLGVTSERLYQHSE